MNNPHHLPKHLAKDQIVIGLRSVHELLEHNPKLALRLYTSKSNELSKFAEKMHIPVTTVSSDMLTKIADSDSHQGVLVHIKPRVYLSPAEFLKMDRERSCVLMLDQIFDPQNFGALLRTAECFGVDAVIWSKNRGCELTAAATKTSCGASEILPLIRVSNLATALDVFKEADYEIVASLLEKDAKPAYTFNFSEKTVLIMGSEGEGIQPLLQKKSDRSIYLPMQGKLQSLNVANAASALLAIKTAQEIR